MLDEYIVGEASRISSEAPVPVLHCSTSHSVLGGAANTAANVVALGGQVALIGMLGRDAAGDDLAQPSTLASAAGLT
jgi:bifunctional ADP-heptose synthase (sugar kinase/adenylyltransferase)